MIHETMHDQSMFQIVRTGLVTDMKQAFFFFGGETELPSESVLCAG